MPPKDEWFRIPLRSLNDWIDEEDTLYEDTIETDPMMVIPAAPTVLA